MKGTDALWVSIQTLANLRRELAAMDAAGLTPAGLTLRGDLLAAIDRIGPFLSERLVQADLTAVVEASHRVAYLPDTRPSGN